MVKVAPSVLNADFSKKEKWVKELEEARADRIHWDIMDNKYVPNTGVPKERIAELRPLTKMFFESHLMVENPDSYVKEFSELGNGLLTFHVETVKSVKGMIKKISDFGMKTGICVNNLVPAKKIAPYLDNVDLVLVMSVEAGFGGQKFNEKALQKIAFLQEKIDYEGLGCEIEVDGGINAQTGLKGVASGADVLVAGNYIFKHENGVQFAVEELKRL